MQLQYLAEMAAKYVNTTHRNIFLTGKAGTGKTTFLKYIIAHTYKRTIVAAPTGIAAINAGGVTLHSLLQLPFGTFVPENIPVFSSDSQINTPQTLFNGSKFNASKRKLIQEMELLIIDEVSMLRADLLDCIDHTLKYLRRNRQPFGGVQLLLIGDLLQLPPVVKESEKSLLNKFYPSLYFFEAKAIADMPPIHIELEKIYRQQDQRFIELLNRLRTGDQTIEDLKFLNGYFDPECNQTNASGYIHLTTHNHRADHLNQQKLNLLEGNTYTYDAHIEGNFPESMFPTVPDLQLKEGAQVMFIKNDPSGEGLFFNGKIGIVAELDEDMICVRFEDGDEVSVSSYKWENKRYSLSKETNEIEEKFIGSFEQYPLKLAWAVTVHKSQGLTFDKAILDLTDTFAPGQLYVALSRLTSLDGLLLSSPLPESPPGIDVHLSNFGTSKGDKDKLRHDLAINQKEFLVNAGKKTFNFEQLLYELSVHLRSFNKDENRSLKQKFEPWTKEFINATTPLQKIGEGYSREMQRIAKNDNYLATLDDRTLKAKKYFLDQLIPLVERIQDHVQEIAKGKKIKGYQKELKNLESMFLQKIQDIERLSAVISAIKNGTLPSSKELSDSKALEMIRKSIATQKKDKIPTAEISYQLYKKGNSLEGIAKERGMVLSTIEGHLSQYIANGSLDIFDLVKENKVKKIMAVLESEAVGLTEIKSKLPKSYSYGEIKMVIAYSNQDH